MKRYFVLLIFILSPILLFSQSDSVRWVKRKPSGIFSLGTRSTISMFSEYTKGTGFGTGGQFRLQFERKVNSEWFLDYISANVMDKARRQDVHIGWSIMFYPGKGLDPRKYKLFTPYIAVGHCFDLSLFSSNTNPHSQTKRWSAAIQGGLGTHINLSPRFDFTILSQYMLHIGTHTEVNINTNQEMEFVTEKGTVPEGHLLTTFILSYKIADLW